jgi:hypothetical protein
MSRLVPADARVNRGRDGRNGHADNRIVTPNPYELSVEERLCVELRGCWNVGTIQSCQKGAHEYNTGPFHPNLA